MFKKVVILWVISRILRAILGENKCQIDELNCLCQQLTNTRHVYTINSDRDISGRQIIS
jgi:hypothetical protein